MLNTRGILQGVFAGASICFAYATVEFILLGFIPVFRVEHSEWNAPFGVATALLFGGFVAIGAAIGAVIGGLTGNHQAPDEHLRRLMGVLSIFLSLAFGVNLAVQGSRSNSVTLSMMIAFGLAAALAINTWWPDRWRPLQSVSHPLCVSAFLTLPFWLGADYLADESAVIRLLAIGLALLCIAVAGRALLSFRKSDAVFPYGFLSQTLAVLSVSILAGVVLSPGAPKLPARSSSGRSQQPNVVMVVMDTVRADHTSLYGYKLNTTPFLKELSKEATVYDHAFAVSDFTLPTHASMFTGLYPRSHGAYYAAPTHPFGRPLSSHFVTLAESLRDGGYRTMGVVANYGYLQPMFGLSKGFESYDWRKPVSTVSSYFLRNRIRYLYSLFTSWSIFDQRARQADEITDAAIRSVRQIPDQSPFFLFVNYLDAHGYAPPRSYLSHYSCPGHEEARARLNEDLVTVRVLKGLSALSAAEQACLVDQYDANIEFMDAQLRRLIDDLRAQGRLDNTLLIVTSDHGEAFGERNFVGHGGLSVYQTEVGIPLLIRYPGKSRGEHVTVDVSQVDLMPTVLEAAGLKVPSGLAGVSLMRPVDPLRTIASVEYPWKQMTDLSPRLNRRQRAFMVGPLKFVSSSNGVEEAFNLSADPHETKNLLCPEYSRKLSELKTWWEKSFPILYADVTAAEDHEVIDRLKSLGYAQ